MRYMVLCVVFAGFSVSLLSMENNCKVNPMADKKKDEELAIIKSRNDIDLEAGTYGSLSASPVAIPSHLLLARHVKEIMKSDCSEDLLQKCVAQLQLNNTADYGKLVACCSQSKRDLKDKREKSSLVTSTLMKPLGQPASEDAIQLVMYKLTPVRN